MKSLPSIKNFIIGLIVFLLFLDIGIGYKLYTWWRDKDVHDPLISVTTEDGKLGTFSSCEQLSTVFKEYQEQQRSYYEGDMVFNMMGSKDMIVAESAPTDGSSTSHSETNVQVAGVDEADIVKNNGEYIFTLDQTTNEITIVKAYPVSDAKVVSTISFATTETPSEMFISDETLLVVGSFYSNDGEDPIYPMPLMEGQGADMIYPYYGSNYTFVKLYSLANYETPRLRRSLEFQGSYQTSRKIDDEVYFVINDYKYWTESYEENPEALLPYYNDNEESKTLATCGEISPVLPFEYPNYLNIISVSMSDYDKKIDKEVLLGGSENVYASLDNLYIANTTYERDDTILEEMFDYFWPSKEMTTLYKFTLDNGDITYDTQGQVDGWVLNQFSMDEYNDYFRIATTQGHVSRSGVSSTNNVFVLDNELEVVGSVENIAPGEQIYSARFMGDKGYVVTFEKVDPFFTFDLSDPTNPQIIGQLKIPGYSDYLHPLDENHIIGLGKNAVESTSGDFSWYQGVKLAIFDVTDFSSPKELDTIEIGDRGTDSYALYDHKAFLFDKEKQLLVIPVAVAEISPEDKAFSKEKNVYGDFTFQGAYVYRVTVEKGFEFLGRVTHYGDDFSKDQYYYYYGDNKAIQRSLYIDDVLYTVSGSMIKMNELYDLKALGEVKL